MTIAEKKSNYILRNEDGCTTAEQLKAMSDAANRMYPSTLDVVQHPDYDNLVQITEVFDDGSKLPPCSWPKDAVHLYSGV